MHISHEAIYQQIYTHWQAKLNRKLIRLLTQSKTYRHRANKKSKRGVRIKDGVSIDEHSDHIELRTETGH